MKKLYLLEIDDSEIECDNINQTVRLRDMKEMIVCRRCKHWFKNDEDAEKCYLFNDSEQWCSGGEESPWR